MSEYGINDVLREIRDKSFTQRAKGATFEKLMKQWFMSDPRYANRLEKVWLWEEFPSKKDFGGKDLGIDLVAKTEEGDYWAIQCKCYDENAYINERMVANFLATSSKFFDDVDSLKRVKFAHRIWVATTNKWNDNAEETIKNQDPPVTRISLNDLMISPVDWGKLIEGITGRGALSEGKQLRKHQLEAISCAEKYYKDHDRGKLIMACGTGKTFTSLRLIENEVGGKGLVLFMVPSIGLLGQTLNDWATDAKQPIKAICICSDNKVSRKTNRNAQQTLFGDEDETAESIVDLAVPASTDSKSICRQLRSYRTYDGLVVVFSTYQSIDVVSEAQRTILQETHGEYGVFDFIVCDEAHRTTGVKDISSNDESNFIKIHSDSNIQGKKRLYMTATPRLYGENAKIKATKNDCILCSMDDPDIYGEEFYRFNFSAAVSNNILTDYKVLVLTVSEDVIPKEIMREVKNKNIKELNYDDTGRLIGVISGLSKKILGDKGVTWDSDPKFMHRALAFTHNIGARDVPGSSKNIEYALPYISEMHNNMLCEEEKKQVVHVKARHVDGSMGAVQRNDALNWLAEEPEDPQECRVVTNVRCMSEGIDVPALDAVLFLSARNSQVDVVQSVGRVMRSFGKGTDKEKKYGYIIIPIVVPEGTSPEEALNDNKTFSVVWSILNALRSHDDHFNALVNSIALNHDKGTKVTAGRPGFHTRGLGQLGGGDASDKRDAITISNKEVARELEILFDKNSEVGFYAKLVEKCGDRLYWENWAAKVGEIAKKYIARITRIVREDSNNKYTKYFDEFVSTLQHNLNPGITPAQCIEMLAQHMITRPVFEALFSDYKFVENNSISKSMQFMLDLLESETVDEENKELQYFYDSVQVNVGKIDNFEGKQTVIKNLYEKFFKRAFPLTVETLGIVYTPVECVDFIIRSVDYILKQDFNTALTNDNVHILDPFVGTGTFVTRLLQLNGIINEADLKRKYMNEIHCNEIVLLAYYIADVNIESVFHERYKGDDYVPFDGICLTDTFQLGERGDAGFFDKFFKENSESVEKQRKSKVRVIIGNPPYSIGQKSANDNAQNQHYPKLEQKIAETYTKLSKANLKKGSYDSYIKAFRWSTDRIDENDGGIVAFISNGSWIDGITHDGFRASIAKEFDKIYVFNLRGNQRTSGELSRREGGKIFGSGSRTPIAITLLVKYPKGRHKSDRCDIYYHDIGDYLKREEKLDIIRKFGSIEKIKWGNITPNDKYDWINQRDSAFDALIPLTPETKFKANSQSVFSTNIIGVSTNRDAWVMGFSKEAVEDNMRAMIDFYNNNIGKEPSSDDRKISWTVNLSKDFAKGIKHSYDASTFVTMAYRPYTKTALYYHRPFIERPGIWNKVFPIKNTGNFVISLSGTGSSKPFSCLITDCVPDLNLSEIGQCFPLYWYEERKEKQGTLFNQADDDYVQHDGITDWFLHEVRSRFAGARSITKEDIFYYVYGLLHSPEYRTRFADDLRKSLPRIPIVERAEDFITFSKVGHQLAELHLNYESVAPHPNVVVKGIGSAPTGEDAYKFYHIADKMRFKSKDDKSIIVYNKNIDVTNIPAEAYEYVVNGKSAIEWIVERYQVKQDKTSGIVNDCNAWGREHNNPRYILDLLLSVINVSTQTVNLIKSLPKLNLE